jgi:hypothetical protein
MDHEQNASTSTVRTAGSSQANRERTLFRGAGLRNPVSVGQLIHQPTATTRTRPTTPAFACIASGIAALWGPAHGGANEAVLKMLSAIGRKERIPEFVARAKDKSDPFRWDFGWGVAIGGVLVLSAVSAAAVGSVCLFQLQPPSAAPVNLTQPNFQPTPPIRPPPRLMGFGHRVYKTYDPRAKIMKQICEQVLESTGVV